MYVQYNRKMTGGATTTSLHDFQVVCDRKARSGPAFHFLNFHSRSKFCQQELPFLPVHLKHTLITPHPLANLESQEPEICGLTRSVIIVLTQFAPVRGRLH